MFACFIRILFAYCAVCPLLAMPRRISRQERQSRRMRRGNLMRMLFAFLLFGPYSVSTSTGIFLGLLVFIAVAAIYKLFWSLLLQTFAPYIFWYNLLFASDLADCMPRSPKEARRTILQMRRVYDRLLRKIGKRIRKVKQECTDPSECKSPPCQDTQNNSMQMRPKKT